MKQSISIDCPYCGTTTGVVYEVDGNINKTYRTMAFCYPEDGGCDSPFSVEIKISRDVQTSKVNYED